MLLGWNNIFLTQILFSQIKWKIINTKNTQWKNINIKNTLCDTHRASTLFGKIRWEEKWGAQGGNDRLGKNLYYGCGEEHLEAQWWCALPKGSHTLLPLRRTVKTWVAFGQEWGNLGACPSSGLIFPSHHWCTREVGPPHQHTNENSWLSAQERARGKWSTQKE